MTRTTGFLKTVASHSLQPYRGCTFGRALCGIGCYVQHNPWLTRGQPWGSFLEVRTNAASRYRDQYPAEQRWARQARGAFGVFLSSSTDPFIPQEWQFQITKEVLLTMLDFPPDVLILQTHTHRLTAYLELFRQLHRKTRLRFHLSIESDRDRLPGLPAPASSVSRRLEAASTLKSAGLFVVITVSPLLPIESPAPFFRRISEVAHAVVIDHYVEGDGTPDGYRTRLTPLPAAMSRLDPASTSLAYRDEIVRIAQDVMPGRVGVSIDGFAGRFLPAPAS
ncbi:MAG: hypothetical protein AB1898_00600 [Acidobacteriota bacterium]